MMHRLVKLRLLLGLCLLALFPATSVRAADAVNDEVVVWMMEFIEALSAEGYFDIAKEEYKKSRDFPGLSEPQKSFLDLSKAKLNVGEILKTKNVAERATKVQETAKMLQDVINVLPTGTDLRDEALMRVATTYFDVANGYVKEIDKIDEDLRNKKAADAYIAEMRARGTVVDGGEIEGISLTDIAGEGTEAEMAARRVALMDGAEKAFAEGEKSALELRDRWIGSFEELRDSLAYAETPKIEKAYYEQLLSIFKKRLKLEFIIAAMYYDYARMFPRDSDKRQTLGRRGLDFVLDIRVDHEQFLPEYLADAMHDVRLCGLVDDPIFEKRPDYMIERNPWPSEKLEKVFRNEVVGERYENRANPNRDTQDLRTRILYLYAESWIFNTEGAYAQADKETDPEKKKAWLARAAEYQDKATKALEQLVAPNSCVGPVPTDLKYRTVLNLNVRFEILLARRLVLEKKMDEAATHLSQAKQLCDSMILNKDPAWSYAGKKYLLLTTAVIKELLGDTKLPKTPGDAMATAERLYRTYSQQKDAGAPREKLVPLLEQVAENYRDCIRLLEKRPNLSKSMRARFIPKAWYYIGLTNFYMDRYYESFIASDQLLQEFHPSVYPLDEYPDVHVWTERASKNIIAAADRQRKATKGKDDFDRKLYAWAMIRRSMREEMADEGKQNKDLMVAIGKQFDDIAEYEMAFQYYSEVEKDSQYYILSYLLRSQAALKLMQGLQREIKAIEDKKGRLSQKASEELAQNKALMVRWRARAEDAAQKFLAMAAEHKKKFGANPPASEASILKQEQDALYGANLLLVQTRYTSNDYAATIANAKAFYEVKMPDSVSEKIREQILCLVGWMEFASTIDLEDEKTGDITKIAANLEQAEKVHAFIRQHADEESVFVSQSVMLLGSRWFNLSNRVKALGEKATGAEKEKCESDYVAYQLRSGNWFKEAKQIVKVSLNFGMMVGNIFTRQEKYEDAEEVYDLVIQHWGKDEQFPPIPSKSEFLDGLQLLGSKYQIGNELKKQKELLELHEKIGKCVYSEQPNYVYALAYLTHVRDTDRKIPTPNVPLPTADYLARLETAIKYKDSILTAKRSLVHSKIKLKKWDQAKRYINDLISVYQKDFEFKILKSEILLEQGKNSQGDERMELFKEAQGVLKDAFAQSQKTDTYWNGTLAYNAVRVAKILYAPQDKLKDAAVDGPKLIKTINLFMNNKDATEAFKKGSLAQIEELKAAGFSEAVVSDDLIAKLAKEAEANAAKLAEILKNEKIKAANAQADLERQQLIHADVIRRGKDQKAKMDEFKAATMEQIRTRARLDERDEAWVQKEYAAFLTRIGEK